MRAKRASINFEIFLRFFGFSAKLRIVKTNIEKKAGKFEFYKKKMYFRANFCQKYDSTLCLL